MERACIILAAGKGTRMKSDRPKVLHPVAGCSMLGHVLRSATELGSARNVVVVAPDMPEVAEEALRHDPKASCAVQDQQKGTADAVASARTALDGHAGPVLVLYGDTPLVRASTLERLVAASEGDADIAILGFRAQDPTGYGRLLRDAQGAVIAIREEAEASDDERKLDLCNSGVLAFSSTQLMFDLIARVGCDNAKGEYYLTDTIEIATESGHRTAMIEGQESEVLGVNSRAQQAQAEAVFQERLRRAAMAKGVTLVAPETVHLAPDTEFGSDVVVEPHVVFGPGVRVGDGAVIKPFSHLEGAHIGAGASIGPYARLRPGADVGARARVGNFVEIKQARLGEGAKVNHLSYVGDAEVGAAANVGAGTITCNYDGFSKHRTEIGAGAFIGSNSALVAPVRIGEGAYVGSGSVVTRDVSADALVLTRAEQVEKPGWAARLRAVRQQRKSISGSTVRRQGND